MLLIAFLRMVTLSIAEIKMILLIPKLITKAERNPRVYISKDRAKIKSVTVPGQGMIPAERMSARSVELFSTLQDAHPQLET